MTDLIDAFALVLAGVQTVGRIDCQAVDIADIAVGVHHPRRDYYQGVVVVTEFHDALLFEGGRALAIIPEINAKCRWSHEAKQIALPEVLMRPPSDTRSGHRDVTHHR